MLSLECILSFIVFCVVIVSLGMVLRHFFGKSKISLWDRGKILVLQYAKYKDLTKTGIPLLFAMIALIAGAIGGESWRDGQWWAVTLGITLITLVINFFVELAYRRIDSRDSDNYSKFIENLLKFNKKITKGEYANAYEHFIDDIWDPVLGNECRVTYYVIDLPEDQRNSNGANLSVDELIASGAILKAKSYNKTGKRGHLDKEIRDEKQLRSIFTSMLRSSHVCYDDIRQEKYLEDMKEMSIDPHNKKYVSFVRIPIGEWEYTDIAAGVLIADSDITCYFRNEGFNYKFAQYVAGLVESIKYDPDRYSDATIGASVDILFPKEEDFPDLTGTPDGDSGRRSISEIIKSTFKK